MLHRSVLLQEAVESLALSQGATVLDGTFGAGGHSRRIAEVIGREGQLIALDQDGSVFSAEHLRELESLTRFTHVTENFRHAGLTLEHLGITRIDAALFDLGLSSTQLEVSGRGFSFQRDEPLLMTYKHTTTVGDITATDIVNTWSEGSIETILRGFGEERFARAIAKGIVAARTVGPITRTGHLVEIIREHTPGWYHRGRTHFATRTFQALRMAVNGELDAIVSGVKSVLPVLRPGGRIALISFHSVEDRAVKQLFRELAHEGTLNLITKKPVVPSDEELKDNPRARSAKLRVAEKV